MSDHSVLSASAAERWVACPVSVLGDADGTNQAAAEGTAMHTVSEQVLRGGAWPALGTELEADGYKFEVTEERMAAVKVYTDYIQSLPWIAPYEVETKVHYGRALGTPHNLSFGTADCFGFTQDADGVVLRIIDAKFGRKAVVSKENMQGTLYAAGVLEQLLPVRLSRSHPVAIVIVQPRNSSRPFEWRTTVGWIEDQTRSMRPAAQTAVRFFDKTTTQDDLEAFPENLGKHCHYCKRKASCTKFNAKVKSLAVTSQVEWNPEVFALTDAIKGYLDDLGQMVLDAAEQGQRLPGAKVVRGKRGNLKLIASEAVIREKARALGIEPLIVKTQEVWSTPAKIRDAFMAANVPEEERNQLFASPEGKLVAVPETDPRPDALQDVGAAFGAVVRI